MTWTPNKLWEGYPIDNYSMVVTNNSNTVLSVMVESNTHEYILKDFSQSSCSELNFSVAALSLMYGKSEYTIVNKKFGSGSYFQYAKQHPFFILTNIFRS